MTEYQVQTNVYNGPMDLLLYLIRREEVDIYDIPVARITEQYCQYVEALEVIDPNIAGDFLVLAAMLMELKSRMLLPRAVTESGEPDDLSDPRMELVRQLLEYKKFKDASFELGAAAELQMMRLPRVPVKITPPKKSAEVDLDDVQIWDLVAAFNKLMSEIGAGQITHDVIFDDTPVALHAADILDRLQSEEGEMTFARIFTGRNRAEMIGLFLALLELMRQQRVKITQTGIAGDIHIVLLSANPIEVGDEWESTPVAADGEEAVQGNDVPVLPEDPPTQAPENLPPQASEENLDEDLDEEEANALAELDKINVDIDIDSILKQPTTQNAPDIEGETES